MTNTMSTDRADAPVEHECFTTFIAEVEELRSRRLGDQALASAVGERLSVLLRTREWLREEHLIGRPDRYQQHVIHVAADGGFSVVSLIWRPGQQTSIHDHVSWCVVGVYEGEEQETRYSVHEQDGARFLTPVDILRAGPGRTVALVPPEEDVHKVTNVGAGRAVSIHVYGADIAQLGSSINHCFTDLPIRENPGAAPRVSWRAIYG